MVTPSTAHRFHYKNVYRNLIVLGTCTARNIYKLSIGWHNFLLSKFTQVLTYQSKGLFAFCWGWSSRGERTTFRRVGNLSEGLQLPTPLLTDRSNTELTTNISNHNKCLRKEDLSCNKRKINNLNVIIFEKFIEPKTLLNQVFCRTKYTFEFWSEETSLARFTFLILAKHLVVLL